MYNTVMRLLYKDIFMPGSNLRSRLDGIMSGNPDDYPNTSGSQPFEVIVSALAKNKPNPIPLKKLKKGAKLVEVEGELIPRIHKALDELFHIEKGNT